MTGLPTGPAAHGGVCSGPNGCRGRRYTCKRCKRFVPFCNGGAGDSSGGVDHQWCDTCWAQVRAQEDETQ